MEDAVPNLPRCVTVFVRLDDAALRVGKLVEGGNDLALPNFVAVNERETEDVSLHDLPGLGQIVQILLRHRIDPEAVASLEDNELFGRETGQRLSQRTHAHPIARAECGQQESLSGFELSGNDVVADTLGCDLRERPAACFNGRTCGAGMLRH